MEGRSANGHLIGKCAFRQHPNRGVNGRRFGCPNITKDAVTCGCHISKQACWTKLCAGGRVSHWWNYCNSHIPRWYSELSACANERADELKLPFEERILITNLNIEEILGLPSDEEYNHISDSLRERTCNNEYSEQEYSDSENEESDNTDSSENSENEQVPTRCVLPRSSKRKANNIIGAVVRASKKIHYEKDPLLICLSSDDESENTNESDDSEEFDNSDAGFIVDDEQAPDNEEFLLTCTKCNEEQLDSDDTECWICGVSY
ncbi:Hypothetical protein PACV_209 [Pacmanvirus A23]|uniref:Hypothetical protein n=1 Tax=Pacmanvirus A23 TaxID=1932881 RepID=UPI000A0953D0|nr:Hypothetical protein B9W72_gp207 [Pacmanvirus A23]SIP85924.1 Hypothetical protein PACV_209 [Pacmanvirus A23]